MIIQAFIHHKLLDRIRRAQFFSDLSFQFRSPRDGFRKLSTCLRWLITTFPMHRHLFVITKHSLFFESSQPGAYLLHIVIVIPLFSSSLQTNDWQSWKKSFLKSHTQLLLGNAMMQQQWLLGVLSLQ